MAIDLKTLEKLISLAKRKKLSELEVEDGKTRYRVKTTLGSVVTQEVFSSVSSTLRPSVDASSSPLLSAVETQAQKKEIANGHVQVMSPFVGTFYRAPSPESEPYVSEGKKIKKGDVLCIVEAMKLMNEIESEFNGKVVSVLAENGQPVEYGEPLFVLDPT